MIEHGPDEVRARLTELKVRQILRLDTLKNDFGWLITQLEAALGDADKLKAEVERLKEANGHWHLRIEQIKAERDALKARLGGDRDADSDLLFKQQVAIRVLVDERDKLKADLEAVKKRGAVILESGTKMVDEVRSLKAELARAKEDEQIRVDAYFYDTGYTPDFCVRCSHEPVACCCELPVYMNAMEFQPIERIKKRKAEIQRLRAQVVEAEHEARCHSCIFKNTGLYAPNQAIVPCDRIMRREAEKPGPA